MDQSKGFSDGVQRWLARIPGIRTYEKREHRRETDKRLREHLTSQLQEARSRITRLALNLSQQGKLNYLPELDRLSAHMQQMADTIRYASYGYCGIFDLLKIRDEELDQLYDFDLSLMDNIEEIQAKAKELNHGLGLEAWRSQIHEAERSMDRLEQKFRQRADFLRQSFSKPSNAQRRPHEPVS